MFMLDPDKPRSPDQMKTTAASLRRLADDLDRLAEGRFPSAEELQSAPILARYQPNLTLTPVLCGDVTGHPVLTGTDRTITTSPLYAVNFTEGWARTHSRLYRLGRPIGDADRPMN